MIFSFDDYELDIHDWRLRRAGNEVHIQRKAFEVLRYLLEHRDRPVSRQELLEHVWSGDAVTPAVLTVAVSKARQAIGQSSSETGPIKTEHGRGYRFVGELSAQPAPVRAVPPGPPGAPAPAAVASTPFVGRDAVMAELQGALEIAMGGRGQLRLLEGEPGIGKTRTAEELATLASRHGIEAFWGRSHERAGMPAFWPWLNILRHCLELVGEPVVEAKLGDALGELSRLLPRFASLVGMQGAAPPNAPATELEAAQYRVFDAATRLLLLAAEHSPLLLILDDLHWGDESSIELLGYMLPEIARARVLVVGTLRETGLPRRTRNRASLDFLARHPNSRRISIERLTIRDVEHYAERILGHAAPELSSEVFARTEGNAFFMSEALRSVTTDASGKPVVRLPDAALDIVRQRLVGLGERAEALLAAAAVVGRSFDLSLLSEVAALPVDALRERLQAPLDQGLIVALEEPERFAFSHGLTRRTLYDDLPLADRARLHLAAAEALDRRLEAGGEVAEGRVADHYLRALPHGKLARAIELATRSAEGLERQLAHAAAADQYQRALKALDHAVTAGAGGDGTADPRLGFSARLALLCSLGHARRMAGQLARARDAYMQALELARRQERAVDLAHAAIGLRACQPMRAVPDPAVHEALSEALMVLPDDELALRARVLARLAGERGLETRRLMSQRAAELAVGIADAATRYDVLLARLHATQTPDRLEERVQIADEIIALADAHEQPHWRWEALLAHYDVALRRCSTDGAAQVLARCSRLADALAHPSLKLEVRRLRLQRRLCDGDWAGDEEQEIGALAREGLRLESPFAELYFFAQSATLYRDRGMMDSVPAGGEHVLQRFPWVANNARSQVALLAAEAGQLARARELLAQYMEELDSRVRDEDFVYVTANLLQCAVHLDDRDACARLVSSLQPYAAQNVANSSLLHFGSAHYALGRGAAALGRDEQAREHLTAAVQANRAMGNRGYLARSLAALAVLEAGAGQREPAAACLAEARELTRARLPGVARLVEQAARDADLVAC